MEEAISYDDMVFQLRGIITAKINAAVIKEPNFHHYKHIFGYKVHCSEADQATKNITGKKSLSIIQPYAELMVPGRKTIELKMEYII